MRPFYLIVFLSSFIRFSYAQVEVIRPLMGNSAVFYQQSKPCVKNSNHKNLILEKNNILIKTDTLSLPFTDDFTTNTLRNLDFYKKNFYDTIENAYGKCDSVLGVFETQGRFHTVQNYTYSWNIATQSIDSTPSAPIVFTRFPNTTDCNCIDQPAGTWTLYPESYRAVYDSATGAIRSQYLDTLYADTIITFAPVIYRAALSLGTNWTDNHAYWNTHFPILPPSIGVATLDGLNEFGLPYNNSNPTNKGVADYLTSKPIDLGGLSVADSVYLSFYYQSQGYGDWPNRGDSLMVEFYNRYTSKWDNVWSVRGDTVAPSVATPFTQAMVLVPASQLPIRDYYYNGFQFRFKNIASLAGNNDHWHIDYVRLNKNRNVADTVISDIAFMYPIPSFLKNYETMPASQFTGSNDLADTISLLIRNNNYSQASNNPPATQIDFNANVTYQNPSIVFATQNTFNASTVNEIFLFPKQDFTVPTNAGDSMFLASKASIDVPNLNLKNDTIIGRLSFGKILAYDDGSAEKAYGLEGLGIKKFAQEFILNNPDTLVGFQVHFSNIDVKVEDLIFTFNIWKNIKLNDPAYVDTPIYTSLNKKPFYIDSVNGFATYLLDTPKLVSGNYYLGWSQSDTRNLQIGYDLNSTKGRPHMYIFTNGSWKKSLSSVNGSVMIRSVFRKYYGYTSSIKEVAKDTRFSLYPNPATAILNFDLEQKAQLSLYAINGSLIQQMDVEKTGSISVNNLSNGLYFAKATFTNGQSKTLRFVVAR